MHWEHRALTTGPPGKSLILFYKTSTIIKLEELLFLNFSSLQPPHQNVFFIFVNHLFLAALGLRCCAQAFSSCSRRWLFFVAMRGLLIAVCGLLIAVASLVVEHRLLACGLQ